MINKISSDAPFRPITSSSVSPVTEKPVSRIRKLVSSRNVTIIKRTIEAKYGFMPSTAYCRDLIRFVDEVTNGE